MSTNVPTTGGEFTEKELNDGKPLAAIGYFNICCIPVFLVPLLAAKDNRYAQFHAKQGAVLWGAWVAISIAFWILSLALSFVSGMLGQAVSCFGGLGLLGLFVLMVIGAVNALQGQAKEVPVLGQFSSKVPF